ncbi:hypothetical protein PVAR5_3075 [Paecilomyces variotii No. 5]|uniref:Uncharacterized protein n=1 Tax=Byssochlamys spectabilis (strain No. 5 / NBRC 109023) TaxID=1356009 RepID=V5FC55_BYSSN|nr:hypothetical protein PVAR5_3075 [Paecilomyces variotii No. 5]
MVPPPPTYTRDQLAQYLKRIRYRRSKDHEEDDAYSALSHLDNAIRKDPLSALSELQRRHISTIPFGNSALHYSQHHTISIDPPTLFHKLVERELDGYCMENTGIFYIVLRSLGFEVYAAGGRVSHFISRKVDDGTFGGLGHMVLIVTIGSGKYMVCHMVDVGFGPACPPRPLPLEADYTAVSAAPAELRLIRDSIPEFTDKSQRVWIYQIRSSSEKEWAPAYCFSDIEFLPQDFAVMNFSTSKGEGSPFTKDLMIMKGILDDDEEALIGQYTLSGTEVKERIGGDAKTVEILRTEQDRVNALAKWFGIRLHQEEINGIRGMVSELVEA